MERRELIKVLDKGYVRCVDSFGSDLRVVETARVSYRGRSKGEEQDKKLLFYLYKSSHSSPFESCNITFNIKLPLFVQAQMVRSRTARQNQISGRYVVMTDEFYFPSEWRKQDTKNKQGSNPSKDLKHDAMTHRLTNVCKTCYAEYLALLDMGAAKEMARMVLPQNLYTEIYTNWDIHNLMRFFRLRLDPHAQFEIRQYAQAMFDIFKKLYPWCAEAYQRFTWELVDNKQND